MNFEINSCFDSHVHFWATGQVAEGLRLEGLSSAEDVRSLELRPSHYRARWVTGFGWNQHAWPIGALPGKDTLDQAFGDTPVFFSRVDGHASWINSAAIRELERAGYDFSAEIPGGRVLRAADGSPSGVLQDQAHIRALQLLPDFTPAQHRLFFSSSQRLFNRAGFTHVRDLSMNLPAWRALREMEEARSLTVAIESFVTAENPGDLTRVLAEIRAMRELPAGQLRVHGVKIFIDGSLGSGTAFLSQNYLTHPGRGLLVWSAAEIRELLRASWSAGEQVAIHCIGDEAVHTAVGAAREVSAAGISGRLHLEHVELLRPETLRQMKPLHVTCHLQPVHWLSDRAWLRQTLPEDLWPALFQWEQLRRNKIPFFFGSDSPIEAPSLAATFKALSESAEWGVPALEGDWKLHHSYPDSAWNPGLTRFEDGSVSQVYFKGESLL